LALKAFTSGLEEILQIFFLSFLAGEESGVFLAPCGEYWYIMVAALLFSVPLSIKAP